MNKAQSAVLELHDMDTLAQLDSPMHRLSALSKLLMTVFYIGVTVSFSKYDFTGLLPLVLLPLLGYAMSCIPVSACFRKLRAVLPLVCAVGIANPFFDRAVMAVVFGIPVSGGVISMVTLLCKGVFCLMASFLLVATTGMEGVCRALRQLHIPKMLCSMLLLTYRYISVLLEEVAVMTDAYRLRAPNQKGIHISAWGSFLGQLLLRSMDRAQALYESMLLRGFHGEFPGQQSDTLRDLLPAVSVCVLMLLLRIFPPISIL